MTAEFELYELIKVIHLISIISWFAGLLYLPRIFVYHSQISFKSETATVFQTMERKLWRYIMTPAMISTIASGLYLASEIGFEFIWLHIKISLVLLLVFYHFFLEKCRHDFVLEKNKYSTKFFRIINEIPTLAMIVIISLVILKPF